MQMRMMMHSSLEHVVSFSLPALPDGSQPPRAFPYRCHHDFACSAYIFSRYNKAPAGAGYTTPTFDWVAVQLYESFAHALYNTTVGGQSAADYLTAYIPTLSDNHWMVQFSSFPGVKWPSQVVSLNRTQVVIGLANAWTDGSRALLIMPDQVGTAYTRLQAKGQQPRGFAFWVSRRAAEQSAALLRDCTS